MYAVDVTVSHVHPDCSEGEAVFLPRAVDGDRRTQHTDRGGVVPAGRGVPRGRV